jgi:hypothetical protein
METSEGRPLSSGDPNNFVELSFALSKGTNRFAAWAEDRSNSAVVNWLTERARVAFEPPIVNG